MNANTLKRYFELARSVSMHSNYKIRMGAVLLYHGTPVSVGFNQVKTHPQNYSDAVSIHAEQSCIKTCGRKNIEGSTMFIYREHKKTHMPRMARPCSKCMALLRKMKVRRMYYSTNTFPFWESEDL